LYIVLVAVLFYVYTSPVLVGKYGCAVMHTILKIITVAGSFFYFIAPPHLEPHHQACHIMAFSVPENTEICIPISPMSQYVHSDVQKFAVVFFWATWLSSLGLITFQNIYYVIANMAMGEGVDGVLAFLVFVRLASMTTAIVLIIMAAYANSLDMSDRGAEIFYYEVICHSCIMLFLLTTFYEMATAPEKAETAARGRTESQMPALDDDGEAMVMGDIGGVVTFASPIHTPPRDDTKDETQAI